MKTKLQIIDERIKRLQDIIRLLSAQRKAEVIRQRLERKGGDNGK